MARAAIYQQHEVLIETAYEMGGRMVAEITAVDPIFVTEGRYPGRPTRYGLVAVAELEPVAVETPELSEALDAWEEAIRDADRLGDAGPTILGAAYQVEQQMAQRVHALMVADTEAIG